MAEARAWQRMLSGRRLDLLNPSPLDVEIEEAAIGGGAYDDTGDPLPEATLDLAREADALLLGAVGGPKWETTDPDALLAPARRSILSWALLLSLLALGLDYLLMALAPTLAWLFVGRFIAGNHVEFIIGREGSYHGIARSRSVP